MADTDIVKLLMNPDARNGLEFFPHTIFQPHQPFTGDGLIDSDGLASFVAAMTGAK